MTPRTMESEFTDILEASSQNETKFDLTLEGPLFRRDHPRVVWAKLQYKYQIPQDVQNLNIGDWKFRAFSSVNEAQSVFPSITNQYSGHPWAIHAFLRGGDAAIINFETLGVAVLSKEELPGIQKTGLETNLLAAWLPYALSPELWGPVGKWTRFHDRLHRLFIRHDLLVGDDFPGYYRLKSKAAALERHGFLGTNLDKTYLIVLPWTFSLSALEKLEKIVQQEL